MDGGTGSCGYRALIERFTRLPCEIVITLGGPHHAQSIGEFDAVYLHPSVVPAAKSLTHEGAVRYGEIVRNVRFG